MGSKYKYLISIFKYIKHQHCLFEMWGPICVRQQMQSSHLVIVIAHLWVLRYYLTKADHVSQKHFN